MKVAVVRLADQFGVKKLKKRPCVIISQSKKHTKVCLYAHKPKFKDYNMVLSLQIEIIVEIG